MDSNNLSTTKGLLKLPCNFVVLRQKLLLAQVLVLRLFLFDFQPLGTVAVPDWPLTPQQAPLQRRQSHYGIFIVCATVSPNELMSIL